MEYNFNKNFIDVLTKIVDDKQLSSIYKLNANIKYSVEYIHKIICNISIVRYRRIIINQSLIIYFNISQYTHVTATSLRKYIKNQITKVTDITTFVKTYIVLNHNYPNAIKELTVNISD